MDEASAKAYQVYRDAAEKFNHLVVGASAAVTAYMAQHWTPARLGWNPNTCELLALTCMGISTYLGFKYLQKEVVLLRNGYQDLNLQRTERVLIQGEQCHGIAIEAETGNIISQEEFHRRRTVVKNNRQFLEEAKEDLDWWMMTSHAWRDRFLTLGAILFILSRISQAY